MRVWVSTDPGWEVGSYEGAYRRTEGAVRRVSLARHETGPEEVLEEAKVEGTEGLVLVERAGLEEVLLVAVNCDGLAYCRWPGCQFIAATNEWPERPHSGTCPLRGEKS